MPRVSSALTLACARSTRLAASRPKATFSQTGRLSNRAPPWKSIPNLRRNSSMVVPEAPTTSTPSTRIEPLSGVIRPSTHLISTDLPVPEPPMTTRERPAGRSRSTPLSTRLGPKLLVRPRIAILGADSVIG